MAKGDILKTEINAARTFVAREYEGGHIHWMIWCPACKDLHLYSNRMHGGSPGWDFNGNMEKPTITPSLRYLSGTKCHINLTDGMIIFHGDCPHDMANTTVELPQIPVDHWVLKD